MTSTAPEGRFLPLAVWLGAEGAAWGSAPSTHHFTGTAVPLGQELRVQNSLPSLQPLLTHSSPQAQLPGSSELPGVWTSRSFDVTSCRTACPQAATLLQGHCLGFRAERKPQKSQIFSATHLREEQWPRQQMWGVSSAGLDNSQTSHGRGPLPPAPARSWQPCDTVEQGNGRESWLQEVPVSMKSSTGKKSSSSRVSEVHAQGKEAVHSRENSCGHSL
ncbi:PREDICTED: uncharacterized protein LOC102004443 [Chinchilla lanigera]|uniref:uncharacterized protein LOC102004443 n=1 Tax=Chinchilla lanigera TaxID=34839 RepID=UPI00038EDF36|nr:PREDICTED: uncharacterized protein LOC102004443 [Chinchilla lanigera]